MMRTHAFGEEAAITKFKEHLSTPPCYSKILYSEASCNNTLIRSFHAACCRDSFFLRQLTGFENIDLPVSFTNRNKSPLYVGRLGDTRWQIAGYDLSLAVQAVPDKADPITGMSDAMKVMFGGMLCLGSQHVQPGTFVWNGNKFTAQATEFAKNFGYKQFEGEIIVESGLVSKMIVKGSGMWKYTYSNQSTNIPFGLPAEIIELGSDEKCQAKIVVQEMAPGDPLNEPMLFDPKNRIDPTIAIVHIYSNNVQTVETNENPLVTQINMEEVAPFAHRLEVRRHKIRIYTVIVIVGITISFLLWMVWKRQR